MRILPRVSLAVLLALMLAFTTQARADATQTALRAAQDMIAATDALSEATRARDRVAALTMTIRAYEQGLAALREGLRGAAIREAAIRRSFDARSGELADLLGVMMSMERLQGPVLLLHPSGPLGSARAGMMLADVTPALQAEAEAIGNDLREIATIRALQQSAALTLEDGLRAVQVARTELSQAIADRRDLPRRTADDPDRLRMLLLAADTLDAFAAGLAETGSIGTEGPMRDFSGARGQLPLPVAGTVLRRAGEADAAGIRRPGLLLATQPRALVTTPWPATIRYRGPLLDYGNVMVLEPAEDYLLILAGLDIVYGSAGEVLPAGVAVGLMGGQDPRAEEFVVAAMTEGRAGNTAVGSSETLYVELRHNAEPVDPADWFAPLSVRD